MVHSEETTERTLKRASNLDQHMHILFVTVLLFFLLVACDQQTQERNERTVETQDNRTPEAQDERMAETQDETLMEFIDEGPEDALIFRPEEIEWQDGPGSFQPGSQFSVLEGDPGEQGVFNMRIKMPDGFKISPHWHPNVERVTVISGTFRLGHGEVADFDSAEPLSAGSYFSMPPEMVHYAIAEGETIIQLKTIGPWEINYVNPNDDPRQVQ